MIFNRIITVLLVLWVLFVFLTAIKLHEVYTREQKEEKKGWLALSVLMLLIYVGEEIIVLIMRGW